MHSCEWIKLRLSRNKLTPQPYTQVQLMTGRALQDLIASQPAPLSPRPGSSPSFSPPSSPDPARPGPPPKALSRRFSQLKAAATSPTARTVLKHAATVSMFVPVLRKVVQHSVPPEAFAASGQGSSCGPPGLTGDAIDARLDAFAPFIAEVDRDVPPSSSSTGAEEPAGGWWDERVDTAALKEFANEQRRGVEWAVAGRWDSLLTKASREQTDFLENRIRVPDPEEDWRTPEQILWLVVTNADEEGMDNTAEERPASTAANERDSGYGSVSSASAGRTRGASGQEWITAEARSASPIHEERV